MIPVPGETPGAWGENTGSGQARAEAAVAGGYSPDFDEVTYFLHDVPADVLADGRSASDRSPTPCSAASASSRAWPVPVKVVVGRDDRFFPAEFQQRAARDRLGVAADVLPGGHLIALAQPEALAGYLLAV